MATFTTVNKPQVRSDARLKASGTAKYATDYAPPGALSAKVLHSPHAHARIVSIDTSQAKALPGVYAVITAADLPRVMTGRWLKDRSVFAWDVVRHIGDTVAAVAAVDEETAEEALELIKVEYEVLPAVFDPMEALKPDAPLVHKDMVSYEPKKRACRGNIHLEHTMTRGNVEAGFKQSDVIHEATYSTPFGHQGFIQPHQTVASVDANGKLTVWAAAKDPFRERQMLAEVLKLPMSKVKVIPGYVGGDFGGKGTIGTVEAVAAALALKSQRPVRMANTWQEELGCTFARARTRTHIKAGARKDGTLVALQVWEVHDSGAYMDSIADLGVSCSYLQGPYVWPNMDMKVTMVYTNNTPTGHCRGVRVPAESFAIESHIAGLAARLGMDPLELRLKNAIEDGYVMAGGSAVRNVSAKQALEAMREYLKREKTGPDEPNTGWGISLGQYGLHALPSGLQATSCCVKMNEDGTAVLITGSTEQGVGILTALQAIVAEELAMPMEDITLVAHDTDAVPWERGTGASQTLYRVGPTVRMAAVDARQQLLSLAAEQLKVAPGDLTIGQGRIFVRDAPEMWVPVAKVAAGSLTSKNGPILGTGHEARQDRFARMEAEYGIIDGPAFGGNAVKVRVDPETGKVTVLKYYIGWEVGCAVAPSNVIAQLQGGAVFGLGFALSEEMQVKDGKVLNNNLLDFRLPTAADAPMVEAAYLEEAPSNWGPYGAKGMAEGANAPVAAAVMDAVHSATGVWVRDLPVNPEHIFAARKAP
ncbi:MAG: xanthine dehydrogenase family protein molybdopterin-binding subunit [Chloroflexi bacterium]|nr:xanthine dehydrogenase family protein molybdopterin-binding subunit [Chloroflexota bacterium]